MAGNSRGFAARFAEELCFSGRYLKDQGGYAAAVDWSAGGQPALSAKREHYFVSFRGPL
jgi:hypothetical protein